MPVSLWNLRLVQPQHRRKELMHQLKAIYFFFCFFFFSLNIPKLFV
uniref:Uncharacterized protein n=1 Tax=Anguilla anguilla TaxID=7936 RepID=A0A0E9SEC8_ANGAN